MSKGLKNVFLPLLIIMLVLNTFGAVVLSADKKAEISITQIDYLIENIHPTYWAEYNADSERLFYNFFIYIDKLKDKIKKIKQARIYNVYGTYWELNLEKELDLKEGYLGGICDFSDTLLTENGSLLALKDLKVEITLTSGRKVEQTFSIAEPGSMTPTKGFIYSETYRGKITPDRVPALKLASIAAADRTNRRYRIRFSVNDSRVTGGSLWLLNQDKNYIGETKKFINPYSSEVSPFINDGKTFYTDGTENRFECDESQLTLEEGNKAADIKYVLVHLNDGAQYADSQDPSNYNYDSISELFPLE